MICKLPRYYLPSLELIGLLFQGKKRKIDLQDGGHGGHLVFPIGTILAFFFFICKSFSLESTVSGVKEEYALKANC